MFQRSAVLFRLPCTLTARGNGAGSAITATAARSFKSTAYINVNGALKMQQNTSRRTFMTSPLRMNVSDTSAAPITPISQGEAAGREQCAYLLASNQRDPENRATGTPTREGEDLEKLRARLLYQSRKRGIKENDLIMGTFFLHTFDFETLKEYDVILNEHDNEWDMYNWMVGNEAAPDYLQKSDVMSRLIEHAKNTRKELRIELPPLRSK
eukprot:gene11404-19558_t